MTKSVSAIYHRSIPDLATQIKNTIDAGCARASDRPLVFFRADDIGIPGRSFTDMITTFTTHRVPLCLAAVPAWLNQERLETIRGVLDPDSSQWCWHQHGYVHRNFEPSGKKQEFGPARSLVDLENALTRGRNRLEQLLGRSFNPLFTPPWNRCSQTTITLLQKRNYLGLSRSRGAVPATPETFPDFQINVDLHTRKESSPEQGLNNLLAELERALESKTCGIMIHHQRMNRRALDFLNILLEILAQDCRLTNLHFGDLINTWN